MSPEWQLRQISSSDKRRKINGLMLKSSTVHRRVILMYHNINITFMKGQMIELLSKQNSNVLKIPEFGLLRTERNKLQ